MELDLPQRFVQIDEDGYALISEARVKDDDLGNEILTHLEFAANGSLVSRCKGDPVLVEAFDEPLVALDVSTASGNWHIYLQYSAKMSFELASLSLDEWDRFHGETKSGIPFVFSPEAPETY